MQAREEMRKEKQCYLESLILFIRFNYPVTADLGVVFFVLIWINGDEIEQAVYIEAIAMVEEQQQAFEPVLFQVPECYVYMIPPRISAASYRADEWNVNKWAWEGSLKVISKGVECIIRLEDKTTGELYARAFLRDGEPYPVETVIDSSRYFVLQVEEDIGSLQCFL
ncbi:Adaptin ear-binding coat-associated protein 1 NECAP-1 [Perilla frutescens var. frutescens]|nr:Adaptin ear-binding coat-associated protein 1 NECAP-1 [Perilla frutescens var. frutescens]